MKHKGIVLLVLAMAATILFSTFSLGYVNHARWNSNLGECVYFYQIDSKTHAHCYVPEANCNKDGRNVYKNVDTDLCYYTARKAPKTKPATTCSEFKEGDLIILDYKGSDPDADIGPAGKLIYTIGEPFDGDNKWQTKRGDAGTYTVEVTVSDGEYESKDDVCFKILPANTAPKLTVPDVSIDEGSTVRLQPKCVDPDGDKVMISYSGDMNGATWKTGYDDAGTYAVKVTCQDAEFTVSQTARVTVRNVDRKPELSVPDVTVREGETVELKPVCTDPEGSKTSLRQTGDLTSRTWKTGYKDAGKYTVTFTCSDENGNTVARDVTVTVLDKNRPPRVTAVVKKG